MSSGGGLACCCCRCTQLNEWVGLQLGTVDGYTPQGPWQSVTGNSDLCAYWRSYSKNTLVYDYKCQDICEILYLGGPYTGFFELEVSPATNIQFLLIRYRYGDELFPACDPDNNTETAFDGCKYVLMSRHISRVIFYFGYRLEPLPCPRLATDAFASTWPWRFQFNVIWNRISKPFPSLPSGSFTFDSEAVSTCYCDPPSNPNPSCDYGTGNFWFPFNFELDQQCVSSKDAFTLLGSPCTASQHLEYCFDPPSWTVNF
jgi:hypothetical protein